ncbi:hypothetical protein NDU88_010969 [Pleurodeles waltl]|uniref:Uncharacterized protein n=1 Tax=Pleurodeles waltl TaxID=8319 RepID=A0AAV7PZY3_PLEWA|nr:hypothetical protein NDU88_010969 [Pleurodeles waltl]
MVQFRYAPGSIGFRSELLGVEPVVRESLFRVMFGFDSLQAATGSRDPGGSRRRGSPVLLITSQRSLRGEERPTAELPPDS